MRGRFSQDDHRDEDLVNLTPLIDVVFVVLIMFILVAPLLDLDRLKLADSHTEKKREETLHLQEKCPIKITVFEDNRISVNGRAQTAEQLGGALKQLHEEFPEEIPRLFQDRKAHFGTYQTVKNAAEAAGYAHLDVVLNAP